MKFLILLLFSFNFALAQSTGPVYNFNFFNKDAVVSPGSPVSSASPITAPVASPAVTPVNTSQTLLQDLKHSSSNYFARSLLNPEDKFVGIIVTSLMAVKSEEVKRRESYSFNLMTQSLFGIKYIKEKMVKSYHSYDPNIDLYNIDSFKIGINKFIPIFNNIALEVGAYYETGKVYQLDLEDEYDYHASPFHAGTGGVGLNVFSGNFLAGILYQQRFSFSTKVPLYTASNEIKTQRTIVANLGLYF